MKNNQKGFGVIEGILILVIVGIIGGVGWYVWQSKNNADKSLSAANSSSNVTPLKADKKSGETQLSETSQGKCKNKPASPKNAQFKVYTDNLHCYSFEYPKTLKLSVEKDNPNYSGKVNVVTLTTPDYKDNGATDITNVIYGGAKFSFNTMPVTSSDSEPVCKYAQKCVSVDGQQASQHVFNPSDDGDYFVSTFFIKNNLEYNLDYSFAKNNKDKYLAQYNALVASFKTNK